MEAQAEARETTQRVKIIWYWGGPLLNPNSNPHFACVRVCVNHGA